MDFNHETRLFHTLVWWLSNFKLLAAMYEIKDELMLFFEAHGKQDFFFGNQFKRVASDVGKPLDTFKTLNDLNLILQSKNFNYINDYVAINAFVAKLRLGIIQFKKNVLFLNEICP